MDHDTRNSTNPRRMRRRSQSARASPSTLRRNGHPGREGAPHDPTATPFPSPRLPPRHCPAGAVLGPWLPHRQHRAICCLQPLSRVVGALQGRARLQAVLPYPGSSRPTGRRHRPAVPARRHGAGGRLAGRVWAHGTRASPIAVRLRSPARTSPRATGASSISSWRRAMPWSRRITGVGQSGQPCLSACAHCRAQRHRHDQGQPPVPRQRGAVAALGLGRPFAGRCRRAHGGPHRPPMVGRRCSTAAASPPARPPQSN